MISRAWAGLLAVALTLTACNAGTPERPIASERPVALDGWQQVALPGGMTPTAMQVVGDRLLVGGYTGASPGNRSPALVRGSASDPDPGFVRVPLRPATPYGKVAEIVSLTGDEKSVVALGSARGGAHANVRWTIWTGTDAAVVDRPQTFETFGGWDAGTLLGLATDRQGPLILGTWQGAHGPDGAVWRVAADRWVRQRTASELANTVDRQVAPRTVTSQTDRSVTVSGALIDLTNGVRQSAAVWRERDGGWTFTALADPGRRSEAWSTACSDQCWSVGARDGTLAVWSGSTRVVVPKTPVADADSARLLLGSSRTVVVASSNGAGRLLVGHDGQWLDYTAPDGRVLAAELVGSRLLLLTDGDPAVLWARDLADLLDR